MKILLIVFAVAAVTCARLLEKRQAQQPPAPQQLPQQAVQQTRLTAAPVPTTTTTPTTTTPPPVYFLPSGAELIVGDYRSTFRCEGRIYGYYADQDNNCQIFHVCIPFVDEDGKDVPTMYSFFCGNQTVFDQESLVCVHNGDGIPCEDAHLFYIINENFGQQVWHTTPRPVDGYPRV